MTLAFDLARLARNSNETARKTLNFVLVAVGVDDTPFDATFSSVKPAKSEAITFKNGIALSNAGALVDGNGGVPLPLNAFVGLDADQTFELVIAQHGHEAGAGGGNATALSGSGNRPGPGNRTAFGEGMKDVKAMSERDLADYQSGYKTTTAEWKVCEEEFERRRGMPATRGSWKAIWISLAALALTALNSLLMYYK